MRDPLAEDNPYLAEYGEWDLWCYKNARDRQDEDTAKYLEEGWPEDWETLSAGVDSAGWLQPALTAWTAQLDNRLGYYATDASRDCAGSITCSGPMDAELRMRLARKLSVIKAPYYLPLPKWLADAPPVAVMQLPDRRFAMLGEPGSGAGAEHLKLAIDDPTATDLAWAVYSATGELEFAGQPGEHWWQLFVPDLAERTGGTIDDLTCHSYRGLLFFGSQAENKRAISLTWDGRELSDNWDDNEVDPRTLVMLSGPEIPLMYASQQEVEPRQPFGWGIGLSNTATLDVTLPVAKGHSQFGRGEVFTQVKQLDDPGNPYREYYRDCDRTDFREHELICKEYDFNLRLQRPDFEPMDLRDIMLNDGYGNEDYTFIETTIGVDDDGYVIPLILDGERWLVGESDHREPILDYINEHTKVNFTITTARFINPQIDEVFLSERYCMQAQYLPQIPPWLAKQPPVEVVLLPDGEIAARGTLGSAGSDSDQSALPWYRYSQSGELLGETAPGAEWWELYFAEFRSIYAGLGGEDAVTYGHGQGYISFWFTDTEDYHAPEVYSHTGEKAPYAPYSGDDLAFMTVPGKYLAAMRKAQLAAK